MFKKKENSSQSPSVMSEPGFLPAMQLCTEYWLSYWCCDSTCCANASDGLSPLEKYIEFLQWCCMNGGVSVFICHKFFCFFKDCFGE